MPVADEPSTSETTDPGGTRVILKDEIWREKIVRDNPEIAEHRTEVLRAVSAPDHVVADPIFAQRKNVRGVGPSRWLLVVVSYEQTPARIVSAFANRKDTKSWSG